MQLRERVAYAFASPRCDDDRGTHQNQHLARRAGEPRGPGASEGGGHDSNGLHHRGSRIGGNGPVGGGDGSRAGLNTSGIDQLHPAGDSSGMGPFGGFGFEELWNLTDLDFMVYGEENAIFPS